MSFARRWAVALAGATALGILSLLADITSPAQLSGQQNMWLFIRWSVSKLLSAGTVWAAVGYLAGALVRRRPWAVVAGVLTSECALAAHYVFGMALGQFDATVWADNWLWFPVAAIAGAVLGLLGAVATGRGRAAFLLRFVLPLGAIIEPVEQGFFRPSQHFSWPDQWSSVVCGTVLWIAAAVAVVVILRHGPGSGVRTPV